MSRFDSDDMIENCGEDFDSMKKAMKDISENFNRQISKLTDEVKRYASQGRQEVSKAVEEHPLKALGIATVIGFLIGYLLRRD